MDALIEARKGDTNGQQNNNVFLLLDISERLGGEYVHMFDDMFRMLVIQVTLQFMVFMSNPAQNAFLSSDFVLLLFYILIGVALYWLVFRNLVAFR